MLPSGIADLMALTTAAHAARERAAMSESDVPRFRPIGDTLVCKILRIGIVEDGVSHA